MNSVAHPVSRVPTSQLRTSLLCASIATKVHASPALGFFAAIFGVRFFCLQPTKDQISSIWTRRAGTLRIAVSWYSAQARPTRPGKLRIVPFATPVRRDVERTEHPSTSAEMTATCLSVLRRFIMDPSYYTALACQAESDESTRNI